MEYLGPRQCPSRLAALARSHRQYRNVPDVGAPRRDIATSRANAGPIRGQVSESAFRQPVEAVTWRFVIEVLWLAYRAVYGARSTS